MATQQQERPIYNICFHGIGRPRRELEPDEDVYWIDEDTYLDVLDLAASRDDVRLSFDDGNESDVSIGLPGLRARGLVADFYVLAGRLGHPGSLDADDLRELQACGMTIGSHGMNHRSWRGATDAELTRELDDARAQIESAGGSVVTRAACPLGLYDRRVLSHLRRRGYAGVMTSDRAPAPPGAWLQPRYSIRRGDHADSVRAMLEGASRLDSVRTSARLLAKRLR